MGEHDGRVALVTGGSRGIGRGAVLELARQGAAVAVHGQDPEFAKATVELVESFGGRAIAVTGNVGSSAEIEAVVATTVATFGRLDALVTSAGIQRYGDAVETTEALWAEVFDVNVKGVFLAVHCALPYLRQSEAGAIVVVSSVQGTATQNDVVAYTSSKGALHAMTRALAVDEARHGVRVNSVSPGSIDTPMLRAAAALWSDGGEDAVEATIALWGTAHALGRVGTEAEVGAAIAFLAGPRASFITGTDLRVDGGLLSRLAAPLPEKGDA